MDIQLKGFEEARARLSPGRFQRAVAHGMAQLATTFTSAVKKRTPQGRTGKLRKGIRVVPAGDGFRVVFSESYAGFVERGTKPHLIYPRRAKALRFEAGGRLVFAKSARHPGTKGAHMVGRTVSEESRRLMLAFNRSVLLYMENGR